MSEENEVPRKEQKEVPTVELPEEWKDINFPDLFSRGWRPRVKTKGSKQYITLRYTRTEEGKRKEQEKSLGPFSVEKWELVQKLFPHRTWDIEDEGKPDMVISKKMLATNIARHKDIPGSMSIDTDILQYYNWSKSKGYDEPLDRWIQDCVRNYFIQNGFGIAIKINKGE
jgi:hypothetical protein